MNATDNHSIANTVDDDGPDGSFIDTESYDVLTEELRQARREIEVLKLTTESVSDWEKRTLSRTNSGDNVNEDIALELEMSKLQLKESHDAQELASRRLADYITIVQQSRERVVQAENERRAMNLLVQGWKAREEASELERTRLVKKLEETEAEKTFLVSELMRLRENREKERDGADNAKPIRWTSMIPPPMLGSASNSSLPSIPSFTTSFSSGTSSGTSIPSEPKDFAFSIASSAPIKVRDFPSAIEMHTARLSILSSLPIPETAPTDALEPFTVPAPYSLADFLGASVGAITQVENYHVFHECRTFWCSDPEEHGYFLAPVFKCVTDNKMQIIHRWYECDTIGNLSAPMPCFFCKSDKWYYAGTYIGLPLAHLSPQEWDVLDKETRTTLLKDTLSGRRNVTPQTIYEVGQLYSVGALKVACIGLRCIGFDMRLYQVILSQAKKAQQTGAWKARWD